ncbi:GNAT family N-acetyltransferase [Aestuariivivens insulae]|uniref:GNAT family N-acetyltransferase n=1 Tax=Aestuariivivens insulae TaxID=1621988 RepID=UPI001F58D48B|nr:GNAT family N-acetyltransferase [Aestuariivivens insulae]
MIHISDSIQLKRITTNDHQKLMSLMQHIYPPAYKHLWINENTDWYLDHSFSMDNLQKELTDKNAEYYFVLYHLKEVGIIRIVHNKPLHEFPEKPATYIHRIYLGEKTQGKGIGMQLLAWIEKQALKNDSELVWLKAMDTQAQALHFYKKQGFKAISSLTLDFNLIHKPLRGMLIMRKFL